MTSQTTSHTIPNYDVIYAPQLDFELKLKISGHASIYTAKALAICEAIALLQFSLTLEAFYRLVRNIVPTH